jgi:uncharacterized coiled-coil protein SlyX
MATKKEDGKKKEVGKSDANDTMLMKVEKKLDMFLVMIKDVHKRQVEQELKLAEQERKLIQLTIDLAEFKAESKNNHLSELDRKVKDVQSGLQKLKVLGPRSKPIRHQYRPKMSYAEVAKPTSKMPDIKKPEIDKNAKAESNTADRTIIVKGLQRCESRKEGTERVLEVLKQQDVDESRVESIRTLSDEKRMTAIVRFKDTDDNKAMVKKLFFSSYLATKKATGENRPAIQFWRDRPLSERKAFLTNLTRDQDAGSNLSRNRQT